MVGLNKFSDKDRRRQRLRNFVARDLASSKYKKKNKKQRKEDDDPIDYLRDISD